jgi:hypothetical protein
MSERKYFPVLITRNVGTFPAKGTDLDLLIMSKAREMVHNGKMVKGSCPSIPGKPKVTFDGMDYIPLTSNYNLIHTQEELDNKPFSTKYTTGDLAPKSIRVFTSEAAANEWITFITGLDATSAVILSLEEIATFEVWPEDALFDQYVVAQP